MGIFATNEDTKHEVSNYQNLSFFKKSKNVLSTFIIAVSAFSFYLSSSLSAQFGLSNEEFLYGIIINLILSIFIYLNHRWAMIVFCLFYIGDKILLLVNGDGSPISPIIFGVIVTALSYASYRVADQLKKQSVK